MSRPGININPVEVFETFESLYSSVCARKLNGDNAILGFPDGATLDIEPFYDSHSIYGFYAILVTPTREGTVIFDVEVDRQTNGKIAHKHLSIFAEKTMDLDNDKEYDYGSGKVVPSRILAALGRLTTLRAKKAAQAVA